MGESFALDAPMDKNVGPTLDIGNGRESRLLEVSETHYRLARQLFRLGQPLVAPGDDGFHLADNELLVLVAKLLAERLLVEEIKVVNEVFHGFDSRGLMARSYQTAK